MTPIPRISIVTPSLNQGKYLEDTIRSVLDQRYEGLEYVIIDAKSSDQSIDIIKRYAKNLTYWVSEPDAGHADGLNKGFAQTHAPIMGWINSSDIYYPWTLRTVVEIFEDLPEVRWISGIPTLILDSTFPRQVRIDQRNRYDFLAGNYNWLQQESLFWRRNLWEDVGGGLDTGLKYACDFELWLRFFQKTPLYYVNTILAGFRTHENQRGATFSETYCAEAAAAFSRFYHAHGQSDHMRGLFVRLTNRGPGRLLREAIRMSGGLGWYVHPEICFDFRVNRWVLRRDKI